MKKYFLLLLLGFILSGCMASFPAKYSPTFSMDPKLGKDQQVYATTKFLTAFGTESRDISLKLQVLVDKKIEDWGFTRDKKGKNLDITVKNVMEVGNTAGAVLSGIVCGLSLYVIPSVAVDKYRMTVVITEEGKDPITRVYNGSITTYQEILLIVWGIIVYPPNNAMYTTIDNMLDHLMNDLAEDNKKVILKPSPEMLPKN